MLEDERRSNPSKGRSFGTPKHLHTIPTTRGNFSSKIGKSGGGRREIEWGDGRGGAVGWRRHGHGEVE
jgi:hypothetical protein